MKDRLHAEPIPSPELAEQIRKNDVAHVLSHIKTVFEQTGVQIEEMVERIKVRAEKERKSDF